MTPVLLQQAPAWIAVLMLIGALAAAVATSAARALVALVLYFVVTCALLAAAVVALGSGDGALAVVLFGVGVAPFALLGVLLLSVRAVKQRRGRFPWFTVAASVAAAAATYVALPDLGPPQTAQSDASPAPWLALLVFVAGAAALGVLGFGERGAFERHMPDEAA